MRVKHAAVVAGLALGLMTGAAKAAYVVDIYQDGNNVVTSGFGSLDLSNANYSFNDNSSGLLEPSQTLLQVGFGGRDVYDIPVMSQGNFSNGPDTLANSSTGPLFGFSADTGRLFVPRGYKTGQSLGLSTSIYNGQTFASLGLNPGTYVYSFQGEGESFDTFTVKVGVSPVPLPASAPMFGAAILALGAVGYGVKRKKAAAAA